VGCAWGSGTPASSMIGRTIRTNALVDSGPPASGKIRRGNGHRAREQQLVVCELGDLLALFAPGIECRGDVRVPRHRPQLVAFPAHA
jgi:hypothetical protein